MKNLLREWITLCENGPTYGEWKYWVDPTGTMTRVDNHDIQAEDWYSSGAGLDDNDWRIMAMKDGMVRLNLTRTARESEISIEYLPKHVGAAALQECIEMINTEPVDFYFVNDLETSIARQAITAINRDLRRVK